MSVQLDLDSIRAKCAAYSGFSGGTAYVMAKICCQVLMELGMPIPSWTAIREIIGKGSSGDISRGVKDFRSEHADTLRSMNGVVPGVPESLWPLIRGFWENAVAAARGEFSEKAVQWALEIEQVQALASQAESDKAAAVVVADKCNGELLAARAAIAGLNMAVETERAARCQAERMFEANAEEVKAQRNQLEASLRQTRIELDAAFTKFDGERKHSLMRIEDERVLNERKIAVITKQAQTEAENRGLEMAGLRNTLSELRASVSAADKRGALAIQEAEDLRARLSNEESRSQQLAVDNRRLLELIKNKGGKVSVSRVSAVKLIRGNRAKIKKTA